MLILAAAARKVSMESRKGPVFEPNPPQVMLDTRKKSQPNGFLTMALFRGCIFHRPEHFYFEKFIIWPES